MRGSRSLVILRSLLEQLELSGIARGLGKAEMPERVRGQQPAARRALQKPALDQERFDDVLDRVARLGPSSRHRLHPPPPTPALPDDPLPIAPAPVPLAR